MNTTPPTEAEADTCGFCELDLDEHICDLPEYEHEGDDQ